MNRSWKTGIFLLLFSLASVAHLNAQSATDEAADLRTEIEALKKELAQVREDLDEVRELSPIKALIEENKPIDLVMSIEDDPAIGSDDATLTLVEFSDFQCPYCARHARSTYPELKRIYVDRGAVKYVFKDFPLQNHPQAPKAAEAAHCADDQDHFWEMHHTLFDNQKALGEDKLVEYAAELGLDMAQFETCLESGEYAEKVQSGMTDARNLRVRGTPSFGLGYTTDGGDSVRIVKLIRGALPLNQFQSAIDTMLEEQGSN